MIDKIKIECDIILNLIPQKHNKSVKDHPWLYKKLKEIYGELPINELLYLGANPDARKTCELGKSLSFVNKTEGYKRFCAVSKSCPCYIEFAKNNRTKKYNEFSEEKKKKILDKFRQTSIERYGVDNPIKNEEILAKQKKTNLEKYGVNNILLLPENQEKKNIAIKEKYSINYSNKKTNKPKSSKSSKSTKYTKSDKIIKPRKIPSAKPSIMDKYGVKSTLELEWVKDKIKKTNLERYGVENPLKSPKIRQQIKNTNLARYGVENPFQAGEIRSKFIEKNKEKYGNEHPIATAAIREKIKQKMIKNHGVEYPIQSPIIQQKIKNTNLIKYGVENPFQSNEIKEKIKNMNIKKYGVSSHTQKHFSEETKNILFNKEKFVKLLENQGLLNSAMYLQVDLTTISSYLEKYQLNIEDYKQSTYIELIIKNFLEKHKIQYSQNNRKIIPPLEIDFYLPDYNLGIELHGLYWHSEKQKPDIKYHKTKFDMAEQNNIKLLQFWENEIRDNFSVIEKMLLHKLNLMKTVFGARKTDLTEISAKLSNEFLNKTHLQGSTPQQGIRIGAWRELELVGVMTFQPKKDGYELTRFSVNQPVPGLFSKMLKYFIKKYNPKWIQSFSDNRISNGKVYEKNGFILQSELPVTYHYTDYQSVFHRFNFRKKLIEKRFGLDMSNKTEKAAMLELGYDRIWDAGKKEWLLHNHSF